MPQNWFSELLIAIIILSVIAMATRGCSQMHEQTMTRIQQGVSK